MEEAVATRIKRWREDPIAFFVEALGIERKHIWHKMEEICHSVRDHRFTAIKAGHGLSKAVDINTPIYTKKGFKPIKDIHIGDHVYNESGKLVKVIDESLIMNKQSYCVKFDDGSSVIAHAGHLWNVHDFKARKAIRRLKDAKPDYRKYWSKTKTVNTEWISNNLKNLNQNNVSIPIASPIFGKLTIKSPYTIGLWLGDGVCKQGRITIGDQDAADSIKRIEKDGFIVSKNKADYDYQISGKRRMLDSLAYLLRKVGIFEDKHFPEWFIQLNYKCKIEILRGYMDADGWKCNDCASAMVGTTSKRLHDTFIPFLSSMGVKAHCSSNIMQYKGKDKEVYTVLFSPDFQPFHLRRKFIKPSKNQRIRKTMRMVKSCEKIGYKKVKCISVEGDRKLFCCTKHFIPTHNTFSAGRLVLWFLYTHYPSTVVTTAPSETQVEQLLWREIRDAHRNAKFDLGGRILKTNLELEEKWFALGFSTKPDQGQEHATKFQGFHNEHVMIMFDEAAGIMKQIWAAKDFLMTNKNATFVAIGNPSMATGDFVDCFSNPNFNKVTVSVLDSPNYQTGRELIPGLSGREFVDYMRNKFGEESNQWKSRVLGEIPDANANGLLMKKWIKEAERASNIPYKKNKKLFLTWDVADGGDDDHVIKVWQNTNEVENVTIKGKRIEESIPKVLALLRKHRANAIIVDADGVGRIAVEILESIVEDGIDIIAFKGSDVDVDDETMFRNMRDQSHWKMRDLFSERKISLIPGDHVQDQREELEVLCLKDSPKGHLAMESKKILRKILGRSTNYSDSIMMMAGKIDEVEPLKTFNDDYDYYNSLGHESSYIFEGRGMAV